MKTRKFHPCQIAYLAARAAYETARAEFSRRCEAAGLSERLDMTDAELEAAWDAQDRIRAACGLDALASALVAAERAMLEWAHSIAMKIATPAQRAELAGLVDRAAYHPAAWEKMVDAAARLAA